MRATRGRGLAVVNEKPHTERWAYRYLYTDKIFEFCTHQLYPVLGRTGFQIVSRTVAWVYAVTQPAIRAIVRRNLSLLSTASFSDRDAVQVFTNYAATLADYVAVGAMEDEDVGELDAEEVPNVEHLTSAIREGRGVILATAHFSFFEFGTVYLGRLGLPLTIVTLSEPSTELTAWRARWRKRWGAETIEIGADPFSSVQVVRALESGRCMAMLADRPLPEHGLPVDLPNGRIPFSMSPAILASVTGCPIVPAIVTRLPGGKYRLTAKPPIFVKPGGRDARKHAIEEATRELARSLFEDIQRTPKQWYQFVPVSL